jgi:CheY-like chemotaxis protein
MSRFDERLLGTETIQKLRAKGVKSLICGLSAYDMADSFTDAGADVFMLKPLPVESNSLRHELSSIIGKKYVLLQDAAEGITKPTLPQPFASTCVTSKNCSTGSAKQVKETSFLQQQPVSASIDDVAASNEIPLDISVLFVDDDKVLRRLFSRTVKKVLPSWEVHGVESGEAALEMLKTEIYDVIFMDQYMSSTEKALRGTETIQAIRERGIDCTIVGLSANDLGDDFLKAGADCFVLKPIPHGNDLKRMLCRIFRGKQNLQQRESREIENLHT